MQYVAVELDVRSPAKGFPLHITLALDHEATGPNVAPALQADLEALSATILPLALHMDEAALFGRDHNLRVRHVSFPNEAAARAITAFSEKWHRPPPSDAAFRSKAQVFHVSVNELTEEAGNALQTATGTGLFVGAVGGKGRKLWQHN